MKNKLSSPVGGYIIAFDFGRTNIKISNKLNKNFPIGDCVSCKSSSYSQRIKNYYQLGGSICGSCLFCFQCKIEIDKTDKPFSYSFCKENDRKYSFFCHLHTPPNIDQQSVLPFKSSNYCLQEESVLIENIASYNEIHYYGHGKKKKNKKKKKNQFYFRIFF